MVQEAQKVRHWLISSRKISVPDDWLEACIEWVHSENEVTFGYGSGCMPKPVHAKYLLPLVDVIGTRV